MTPSDDQREATRELRAALAVATEGPWVFDMDPNDLGISYQVWQSVPIHGDGHLIARGLIEEDALLMCAVRTHLPTLLAALSSRPALPVGDEATTSDTSRAVLARLDRTIEARGPDSLWVQSRDSIRYLLDELHRCHGTISDLHASRRALASRPSSPQATGKRPDNEWLHRAGLGALASTSTQATDERGKLIADAAAKMAEATSLPLAVCAEKLTKLAALESDWQEEK